MTIIQLKVRYMGDSSLWENLPVTSETPIDQWYVDRFDAILRQFLPVIEHLQGNEIYEARWNVKDSMQGHYVRPLRTKEPVVEFRSDEFPF